MIYFDDGKTKEQLKAERAAAEAERRRPITWGEYQKRIKNNPPGKNAGLISRLQMETVPEDVKSLFEFYKNNQR